MAGIKVGNTYYNLDLICKADFLPATEGKERKEYTRPELHLLFAVPRIRSDSLTGIHTSSELHREVLEGNAALEVWKLLGSGTILVQKIVGS